MVCKIAGCLLFIVPLSVLAQVTAPMAVDLAYHFKEGSVLHYIRTDQDRHPGYPEGYQGGNWDQQDSLEIAVVKVDLDGSATLVVRNAETQDFKGTSKDLMKIGRTNVTVGSDIPMYRIKIDKFGNYLDGAIIRRTERDSISHAQKKDPTLQALDTPDSNRIKWSFYNNFFPRSQRSSVRVGVKWTDSTYEASHPMHIPLSQSPSGPRIVEQPGPSYKSHRYDRCIVQNSSERKNGMCELTTTATNYQVFGGQLAGRSTEDSKEHFFTTNGLPKARTESGVGVDGSNFTRTLTLLSIDSTSK